MVQLCESEGLSSITDVPYFGIDMLISLSQSNPLSWYVMCVFVFAFVLSHNTGGYVHESCVCFVCIVDYTLVG